MKPGSLEAWKHETWKPRSLDVLWIVLWLLLWQGSFVQPGQPALGGVPVGWLPAWLSLACQLSPSCRLDLPRGGGQEQQVLWLCALSCGLTCVLYRLHNSKSVEINCGQKIFYIFDESERILGFPCPVWGSWNVLANLRWLGLFDFGKWVRP